MGGGVLRGDLSGMDGKLIKTALQWMVYKVTWELSTDSSAAKAMINRDGAGKVKHLDVRALWDHQEWKQNSLNVKKEAPRHTPWRGSSTCETRRTCETSAEMDKKKELEARSVTAITS
eukprot:7151739-Pyramimonas_sp.AAC.1